MKNLLILALILPMVGTCEWIATLCPAQMEMTPAMHAKIGGNPVYLKSAVSGIVYVYGWSNHNGLPEGGNHVVLHVSELGSWTPSTTNSISIAGIENPHTFITSVGLFRCLEDGTPIQEDDI